MLKKDLFRLQQVLNHLKDVPNTKFAYALIKNLKKIDAEIGILNELKQANKTATLEYEKKRIDLCTKHAEKDEMGTPIIENNNYKILDVGTFTKELEDLRNVHSDDFDKQLKGEAEYINLLKEECDIDFYKMKPEDLPDNLTALQLEILEPLID